MLLTNAIYEDLHAFLERLSGNYTEAASLLSELPQPGEGQGALAKTKPPKNQCPRCGCIGLTTHTQLDLLEAPEAVGWSCEFCGLRWESL